MKLKLGLWMVVLALLISVGSPLVARAGAPSGPGVYHIDSLLSQYPLGKDQPMRTDVIAFDSTSSAHLIQVQGAVESHRHLTHDENIWVVRGAGQLTMNGQKYRVMAGEVVHVPRGIPHAFHNLGSTPAVVVSIFSPGFDGKDRVYDTPPDK